MKINKISLNRSDFVSRSCVANPSINSKSGSYSEQPKRINPDDFVEEIDKNGYFIRKPKNKQI